MRLGYVLVMAAALCVAGGAAAITIDTVVPDSTKINVLRQYYTPQELLQRDGMNNVTSAAWSNLERWGSNDGGGWNDEANIQSAPCSRTWLFPNGEAREIGSWSVEIATAPGTLVMEYLDEFGDWHVWSTKTYSYTYTFANTTNLYTAGEQVILPGGTVGAMYTETPVTAYGIRYTASEAPQRVNVRDGEYVIEADRLRFNEIQVFLTAGQDVKYTDGYNIFTQDIVKNEWTSDTAGAWRKPNGGSAAMLHNGFVHLDPAGELKNQEVDTRSYVAYELYEATPMTSFTWGGTNGQGWKGGWAIYTCNGEFIDPSELGNTMDDLIAAGWTLQYAYAESRETGSGYVPGVSGDVSSDFLFGVPGFWKNILIVWDGQNGAMRELEIHASAILIPEPATMSLLALGGLALLRRRK